MLAFYDHEQNPLTTNPLKSFHNGYEGEAFENFFYLRNSDPATYYSGIIVTPKFRNPYYNDSGVSGNTGWSVKVMYGRSKPNREDWDTLEGGEEIYLPDIGTREAADTSTFHPVWFRVYCPGGTEAQIKKNIYFEISFKENQVA